MGGTEVTGAVKLTGRQSPSFAVYDEGSFFSPHVDVDQASSGDPRVLTAVYYLNRKWKPKYGGALRIKPETEHQIDIWPEQDTLVIFRADTIVHEVLKSKANKRYALTLW